MSRLDARRDPDGHRPDPRTDPARGLGRGRCLAGAVRLVPPARSTGARFLDAVAAAEGALTDGGTPRGQGRLGILRSASAWLAGDWRACIDRALAGLELLGDAAPADPIGRFGWSLVAHGVALDERWSDDDRGRRGRTGGRRQRHRAPAGARRGARGGSRPRPDSPSTRCASPPASGAWRRRPRCGRSAPSSTSPRRSRPASSVTGTGPSRPSSALAGRSAYPCTYVQVLATLELVEMRLGDGDVAAARSLFHQAEELAGASSTGPDGAGGWPGRGCWSSLAEDDLAAAEHWSGQIDDPFWGPICEARVHLAAGTAARRRRGGPPRGAALRAAPGRARAACWRAPSPSRPRRRRSSRVETAVERAAEHGMLQTVAADGGAVLELVELAAWRAPGAWMDRLRRALVPGRPGPRPARASSRS